MPFASRMAGNLAEANGRQTGAHWDRSRLFINREIHGVRIAVFVSLTRESLDTPGTQFPSSKKLVGRLQKI